MSEAARVGSSTGDDNAALGRNDELLRTKSPSLESVMSSDSAQRGAVSQADRKLKLQQMLAVEGGPPPEAVSPRVQRRDISAAVKKMLSNPFRRQSAAPSPSPSRQISSSTFREQQTPLVRAGTYSGTSHHSE